MISQEDIDAMAPNAETFSKVKDRAKRGKASDRLINANEYLPVIRYAEFLERKLIELGTEFLSMQQVTADSMEPFKDPMRE